MKRPVLQDILEYLPRPLRALAIRFNSKPIGSVEDLAEFVRTRSAFIAQTSLYGYLKTRMGTRFPEFFEDDVFSQSIQAASVKLFVSCLGDLTVYTVATSGKDGRMSADEAAALARHCFTEALRIALAELDADHLPPDASDLFDLRTRNTQWANAAIGANAFAGSEGDLIRYAPVIDEFKELDREIVTNSIRFRWLDVRDQVQRRLDGDAVSRRWREQSASSSG